MLQFLFNQLSDWANREVVVWLDVYGRFSIGDAVELGRRWMRATRRKSPAPLDRLRHDIESVHVF